MGYLDEFIKKLGDFINDTRKNSYDARVIENEVHALGSGRISRYIEHAGTGDSMDVYPDNALDQGLYSKSFRRKLIDILKREHNIDVVDGAVKKGGYSWVMDIGEGQVLHISSPSKSETKPHIRYNEPEILQPLATLHYKEDLKIEILPKVKTRGIKKEHIYSLVSSLAKKGLLFADFHKDNVGLIEVDGKDIPVVIGDGSVIKLDDKTLKKYNYFYSDNNKGISNNLDFFTSRVEDYFPDVAKQCDNNGKGGLKYFRNNKKENIVEYFRGNNDYEKYPWGEENKKEAWAQNQYVKSRGLKKDTGNGVYTPKGIIPPGTVAELEKAAQGMDRGTPYAKGFADAVISESLREKDARKVAAGVIRHILDEKGGSADDFRDFLKKRDGATDKKNVAAHGGARAV